MKLRLDHLAICATDLTSGTAWAQKHLGVPLLPGGQHVRFGTHNTLLGLGDGIYLEVIAPDPEAAPFAGPRWFDLDRFSGPPRLGNWICASDDIAAAPAKAGTLIALTRGDLAWQIAVPEDGSLPDDGGYPTLIEWGDCAHPATRLPNSGVSLCSLEVYHPQANALGAEMDASLLDPRVTFHASTSAALHATFDTPSGRCRL